MATERRLIIPPRWNIWGDPCPCCGGEGTSDYALTEDLEEIPMWSHYKAVDGCDWQSYDEDEPCSRWPHDNTQH